MESKSGQKLVSHTWAMLVADTQARRGVWLDAHLESHGINARVQDGRLNQAQANQVGNLPCSEAPVLLPGSAWGGARSEQEKALRVGNQGSSRQRK